MVVTKWNRLHGSVGGGERGGGRGDLGGSGVGLQQDGWRRRGYTAFHFKPLGTNPSDPLNSAMVLEYHHPILSMIGGHGGWLERLIEIEMYLGLQKTTSLCNLLTISLNAADIHYGCHRSDS